MSIFHLHKWSVADSKLTTVTEYGYFLAGVYSPFPEPVARPETQVLYRCTCGKVKAERIHGHWDTVTLTGSKAGNGAWLPCGFGCTPGENYSPRCPWHKSDDSCRATRSEKKSVPQADIQRKLIGNLLTRWELMTNDFKSVVDEQERDFYQAMHELVRAVDRGEFWPEAQHGVPQAEPPK